jgi:biopolymer transport protein ExbB
MKYLKIFLLSLLIFSSYTFAQEADVDAPTNLDKLLELVKEGKSKEQSENTKREAEFKAARDQQDQILKAEQRELARQERIADQLEEEFRKNQEKLRIAEEAYLKQLGSLNELFGHMQSITTDSRVTFESSLTAAEFGKDREKFLGDLTQKNG